LTTDEAAIVASVWQQLRECATSLARFEPYHLLRNESFSSTEELTRHLEHYKRSQDALLRNLAELQSELIDAMQALYPALSDEDFKLLSDDLHVTPLNFPDWDKDLAFEIRDYICDLIEELFAMQRPLQERPLTPAEIAAQLAQNPKFEPLRAVYYGGKPISAEQFVRECMDWDCRPIPFDEEAVLVGRRPKRVDVLHERFFRFDGVGTGGSETRLYGWTGWSPEAQANIFLTLAEEAQDKTPFYRWVARLISLPEEAPDIEDPEVRQGLRSIIGDVEPYPYVVMG
jgi:hypothetical protein